jgi:hypothetical protein
MVSVLAITATDRVVLIMFSLFWFALFILSRCFRWDELVYEQLKNSRVMWFWLDVFSVPKTRENCLRLQFAVWILALVLLSVVTIGAVRSGG